MRTISRLFLLGAAVAMTGLAHADGYPSKPVKIIVAYAAGQGTDIATRYLAEQLSKELGQPFVVENKGGAGGNVGTELAKHAPADGYTLTMGTNATHVLNQFLYSKLAFDPVADFEPVALVGTFPMVIAVRPDSPIQTIDGLMSLAKKDLRGSDIAMPSTTARLVVELMKDRSKVDLFGVPYRGSANALADVLGGQVPVLIDTPTALRPQISAGKMRPIGVTSAKPSNLVPNVKTVAEQGIGGFEVVAWNALYAPKGVPAEVVNTLNQAVNKVLARPDTKAKLLDLGFEPAGGTAAQLADFANAERAKWQPIIKSASIKAD